MLRNFSDLLHPVHFKKFNINFRFFESGAGLVVNLVNYNMGESRVHEGDGSKRRPQQNKKTEADIYERVH